ncbi:hypothetical protein [Haloarcula sp. Atlit-7R]|uniref:hypothetical protein n=1 Tax=Haloarcula sp. Atlit-7R TaxID=2282125 RepID=UPI000EF14F2E|nr:hypothetical protein [Haloarcula sp. Atlit-7R]RLM87902.1 hypothetical protein D3D01_22295 [Haloarcula sp. Atlit-7R]
MSAEPDASTTTTEAQTTPSLESHAAVATAADVCGALGCRQDDDLRPAEHPERGTRVLCPAHRRDYLRSKP